MKLRKYLLICGASAFLILSSLNALAYNSLYEEDPPSEEDVKEIVVIHNPDVLKKDKEALIILPGAGDSNRGRRHQKKFFENAGYDLYIPDYFDRKSFDGTVDKLKMYYDEKGLGEYREVHIFSYIMGSWIINEFINKYGANNISTIVYDRSPLQERAPRLMADKLRLIGKIAVGQILMDLSELPYPSIEKGDIKIGILVESKATTLIKMFRKTVMAYGPIDWKRLELNQEHDDLIYTRLNHNQMYHDFDVVGQDILSFISSGKFETSSRREPYSWDVFKRYKKGDTN